MIMPMTNGKASRATAPTGVRVRPDITNRFRPKGGVIKPKPKVVIMKIQKCTGSIPTFCASGKSNGPNTTIFGPVSITQPATIQIASISKTFIAAEILRLTERSKVKLDDPLNVYLPNTPHGDIVTIRHLLSHRSGYFDPVFDDPEFIPAAIDHLDKHWSTSEILNLTFKHALFFEPGSKYR